MKSFNLWHRCNIPTCACVWLQRWFCVYWFCSWSFFCFGWRETYWVILSLTFSSAPQFVSSVQLTRFALWVKAITHTLWVEGIPSVNHCVLIPVFPQCPATFDHSNRNGWHSYSAQIRLCDELQRGVQETVMYVTVCASTCLMEGSHFISQACVRSFKTSNTDDGFLMVFCISRNSSHTNCECVRLIYLLSWDFVYFYNKPKLNYLNTNCKANLSFA